MKKDLRIQVDNDDDYMPADRQNFNMLQELNELSSSNRTPQTTEESMNSLLYKQL